MMAATEAYQPWWPLRSYGCQKYARTGSVSVVHGGYACHSVADPCESNMNGDCFHFADRPCRNQETAIYIRLRLFFLL